MTQITDMSTRRLKRYYLSQVKNVWMWCKHPHLYADELKSAKQYRDEAKAELQRRGWSV